MPTPADPPSSSLDEVYAFLKQFNLYDSLAFLSTINAALKFGTRELARQNISTEIISWISNFDVATRLNIYINTSRIARFLLLSEAHNFGDRKLSLSDDSYSTAYNIVGNLWDKDVETVDEKNLNVNQWFGRTSQWQFPLQQNRLTSIGRAYLLFYLLPKSIPLAYSMEDKMREYFQIGLFEWMATGMAFWLMTNGVLDYELKTEIDHLKHIVTPQNLITFRDLSSGDARAYKKEMRGEHWNTINKKLDIYRLDPFNKMPCIQVTFSRTLRNNTYLVPNAKYLLDRVGSGIFYLLSDKEQEIAEREGLKDRKNPFRQMFGDLYRAYVGEHLKQACSPIELIDLDKNPPKTTGKVPDFALVMGNSCILFEVKLSLLTLDSKTFFDEDRLKKEAKSGSINKAINQLNSFREGILKKQITHDKFSDIQKVFVILVGYEDIFTANSALLPLLEEEYGSIIDNFQLACISDIEVIGTVLENKGNLFQFLNEKTDDPNLRIWSLTAFLEPKMGPDNKLVRSAYDTFMKHLIHGDKE